MSRRRLSSLGVAGAAILSFVTLVALTAPVIAPFSPTERAGRPFERPSSRHLLGTDDLGHDLFTLLLHGTRSSLLIGVASALFAIIVGFAVALVAGYFRGRVEAVLMRIVDLMIAFPFFVLVVVLSAFFGQGLLTTIAVIGLVIWARPARVLRSQVLRIRELDHVVVATSMGAPAPRIILRHIMPRVAPLAAAQFVQAANVAVLVEASLSFLGLGDPGRVSWGTTLFFAQARNAFLTDAWIWWVLPPGIALTLVIVGFAYLGQAVEELADPRLTIKRTGVRRRALRARVADPVPGADPVLQASHFDVEYRSGRRPLRALSDVGLRVGRGSIVGLVGESGSGKSTLVMTALGMLRPPGLMNGGNMFLNGRDIGLPARTGVAAVRGREIALIPQNAMSSLNPAYPVARQVSEAAALTTSETVAAERARDLLELVGIEPERHGAAGQKHLAAGHRWYYH